MSKRNESTSMGKALERINREKSWEERLVDAKDQWVKEFRQNPINMTAMVIAVVIIGIITAWVIGTSIPITDPGR